MKLLVAILFLLTSSNCIGEDDKPRNCNKLNNFFPYKAGIVAEKKEAYTLSFDIFCNLAFKGDYRAQFKMAKYYKSGIDEYVEPNLIYAYVWARISNFHIESRKRDNFIKQLKTSLNEKEKNQSDKLFWTAVRVIPGGARIDMKYEPIDLEKILEKQNHKKYYTGSRIKRKTPPENLGIIYF